MNSFNIDGIEIFNSVYEYLDSNMYLFFPTESESVLIDPHISQDILSIIQKKGTKKIYIILTHEHTDHTSGVYWYQGKLSCEIVCQKNCAAYILEKQKRLPILISFILEERDRTNGTHFLDKFKNEYIPRSYTTDKSFEDSLDLKIGECLLHLVSIPGHSKGSSLIIVNDTFAFTGDSLMKDNPVITRFPGSNHSQYIEHTLPILSSLNPEMIILPGHGEPFYLKEMIVEGKLNIEYK